MTLTREYNSLVMSCDGCDRMEAADKDSNYGREAFLDFIKEMKDNGWILKKIGDKDWEHYCPRCSMGASR